MNTLKLNSLRLSRALGVLGILLILAGVVVGFSDIGLSAIVTPGYYYAGTGLTCTLVDFFLGDDEVMTSFTVNGYNMHATPDFPLGTPDTSPDPLLTLCISAPLTPSQLASLGAPLPGLPYYLLLDIIVSPNPATPGYLLTLKFEVPSAVFEMWWWNESSSAWEKWPLQRTYKEGGVYILEINVTDAHSLTGTPFAILSSRLDVGGVGEIGGGVNVLSIALIAAGIISLAASAALYYRIHRSSSLHVVR